MNHKLTLFLISFLYSFSFFGQTEVSINFDLIESILMDAPLENVGIENSDAEIYLPLLEIVNPVFKVVESPIMSEDFAYDYPSIRTYALRGKYDDSMMGRLTLSPNGIAGLVRHNNSLINFRPSETNDNSTIIVSHPINLQSDLENLACGVLDQELANPQNNQPIMSMLNLNSNGDLLRTYRIAIAVTGEYFINNGSNFNTVNLRIVETINAVNLIFRNELAIRIICLPPFIYTDPLNDVFESSSSRTFQAANAISNHFDNNEYEIGHVFHNTSPIPSIPESGGFDSGGLALIGVVCKNIPTSPLCLFNCPKKAAGWSGFSNNYSRTWYNIVIHEIGHQFGANHTFNGGDGACGTLNYTYQNAYEIGSGTTIMSYATLCESHNVINYNVDPPQPADWDSYFHSKSIEEILLYLSEDGDCGEIQITGNHPPIANANPNNQTYIVPISTPFILEGEIPSLSIDPQDTYTYSWEQIDRGTLINWTQGFIGDQAATSTLAPLFRSFPPSEFPFRLFPSPRVLLFDNNINDFEVLPQVSRTMNFRYTVRDNNPLGGGLTHSDVSIEVTDQAGPFVVTSQTTPQVYQTGSIQEVTWDVAGTDQSPINCNSVDIIFYGNHNLSYPITIATNEPNDGSAMVTIPNVVTTQGRFMVKSADNAFFDISDVDFSTDLDIYIPGQCGSIMCGGTSFFNPETCTYSLGVLCSFQTDTCIGLFEYSLDNENFFDINGSAVFANLAPGSYDIFYQDKIGTSVGIVPSSFIFLPPVNTPPIAHCKDITVSLDDSGAASITTNDINDFSEEGCGANEFSLDISSFDCSNVGYNSVTMTITNGIDESDQCMATVAVIDPGYCNPPELYNTDGPTIFDPCTCRGNGEFDEEVYVLAPSNQGNTWMVQSTTLLDPNTLTPFPPGTTLNEMPLGNGESQYSITGVHLDGIGFEIFVENPTFYPGLVLDISNVCYYPDPQLPDFEFPFCLNSPSFTLTGDAGGVDLISEEFTINGTPTVFLDPLSLGLGTHTITYTVNAGEASAMDPSDPGCISTVSKTFEIIEPTLSISCNDFLQISFDQSCEVLLTPDMIVEGDYGCYGDYSVSIQEQNGNYISNPVSFEYSNVDLIVTVSNNVTGNACWGTIVIEDKLPPVIECNNITIGCTSPIPTSLPTYLDNCDINSTIELISEEIDNTSNCTLGSVTIHRTYIASDQNGNISAPCDQVITIVRPDLVDIPDDLVINCEDYENNNGLIDPTMLGAGVPLAIFNNPIIAPSYDLSSTYCNYSYSSSDQFLASCGFLPSASSPVFKIIRTWTVLDWCTGNVLTTNEITDPDLIQIISIQDENPPVISKSSFTIQANTLGEHPNECTSTDFIPPPETLFDDCTDILDLKIFTPIGEAIYINGVNGLGGGIVPSPGLELGTHVIHYEAIDICGNTNELDVSIEVIDGIAPVAVCDEITSVTLNSLGIANIDATVFDDGSFDNCCLDQFLVKKTDQPESTFSNSVQFDCSDISDQSVSVSVRVVDCFENYNECVVEVLVEDKINPTISCPVDNQITCNLYWDDLEAGILLCNESPNCISDYLASKGYGAPIAMDNCTYDVTIDFETNIDQCGEGYVSRTFSIIDSSGNSGSSCTHMIQIDHVSDWVVSFPEDLIETCEGEELDFGEPEIFYDSCELIAISYEDQQFDVVIDACYKIIRDWVVINWCVVGEEINQEVAEVSEIELEACIGFPACDLNGDGDCDDTTTFRDSWNCLWQPGSSEADNSINPDTDPDSDPWDGYITFQQVIKVIDEEKPEFLSCSIPNACIVDDCVADISLPMPEVVDCSSEISITVQSNSLPLSTSVWDYANVEPGVYDVVYIATDNCGNSETCLSSLTINDCKNPTPYCVDGLVIGIMNSNPPMIDIWASDIDAGSFDNCELLAISFSEDTLDTQRIFDCNSLGEQPLELWVTDVHGNQDYCETFVIIDDQINNCDSNLSATIEGTISTEINQAVESVPVNLNGQSNFEDFTNEVGIFNFNIPTENDYTLSPFKDDDHLNGVTTFDIVQISKHILGVQNLDSPYKMIAADANNSQTITTLDIVTIRKLILQLEDHFPNNTSWRFIEKAYDFPNPENPWLEQFPEIISINDISDDMLDADFVAVKIGDVNNSMMANQLLKPDDRETFEYFPVNVNNREIKAGEIVTVDFYSSSEAQGYQFTLQYGDDLKYIDFIPGVANSENIGLKFLEQGVLTVSWNGTGSINQRMFSLNFEAKEATSLKKTLRINSDYTKAEAYDLDDNTLIPYLTFTSEIQDAVQLFQNIPNPFSEKTTILFFLPESAPIKLTITNASGNVIKVVEGTYPKGYNRVELLNKELKTSGILYYQLESENTVLINKMILIP